MSLYRLAFKRYIEISVCRYIILLDIKAVIHIHIPDVAKDRKKKDSKY